MTLQPGAALRRRLPPVHTTAHLTATELPQQGPTRGATAEARTSAKYVFSTEPTIMWGDLQLDTWGMISGAQVSTKPIQPWGNPEGVDQSVKGSCRLLHLRTRPHGSLASLQPK